MLHSTVKPVPLSSLVKICSDGVNREKMDDFRDVQMTLGSINEQKGSSCVVIGSTSVVCVIDGPKEPTKGSDVEPLEGQVNVFIGPSKRDNDVDEDNKHYFTNIRTSLESALQSVICLNLYAKTQIDVEVTILSDCGGVLAASLMATSLALVDAGIQVYDLCVSAHIVLLNDDRLLIDPSNSELAKFEGDHMSVTVGLMPSLRQIVCCGHIGIGTQKQLKKAISSAIDASLKMYPYMLQAIKSLSEKK